MLRGRLHFYSSLLPFFDIQGTNYRLTHRVIFVQMPAVLSSANAEQCSLPILFPMEKVRSGETLLCSIILEIFMTADTISVRVLK